MPNSFREFQLSQGNPGYADFIKSKTPSTNVNITPGEKKFVEERGKQNAEFMGKLEDQINLSATQLAGLGQVRDAISRGAETGFGQSAILQIRKAAQTAGFNADPEEVADQELIQAIGNQAALRIRNPDSGLGLPGAASNRDVRFLQDSTVNLRQTPQGNLKLIDLEEKTQAWRLKILDRANQLIAENNGVPPSDFRANLSRFAAETPIISDQDKQEIEALSGAMPAQITGGGDLSQLSDDGILQALGVK